MELSSDSHSPIGGTTAGETESQTHFSLVFSCLLSLSLSLCPSRDRPRDCSSDGAWLGANELSVSHVLKKEKDRDATRGKPRESRKLKVPSTQISDISTRSRRSFSLPCPLFLCLSVFISLFPSLFSPTEARARIFRAPSKKFFLRSVR